MNFYPKIVCILLFAQPLLFSGANDKETSLHWLENGLPYIQNFSPREYKGEIQNFQIIQDNKGFIYVANLRGVLVYDGISWELIKTTANTSVRSLCYINDTVYVGALGEFGYLAADESGKLIFKSLFNHIPEDKKNFQDVYQVFSYNNGVYFRTRYSLFSLKSNSIKVLDFHKQIGDFFIFGDALIGIINFNQLFALENDSIKITSYPDILNDTFIRCIIPYNKSEFLICTFDYGIFLSDGKNIKKFPTDIDKFLSSYKIYDAANLNNNLLALATSRGAFIIDNNGKLCQVINKFSGLRDEFVIHIFPDREGGLWLGLNNGIARVEAPSPFSKFQDVLGLESFVESIIRFNNKIYAATDRGIFYLDNNQFPFPQFKQVKGFSELSFTFIKVNGKLLAGSQEAIYEIKDTIAEKISDLKTKFLYRSKFDTTLIYVGMIEGLSAIKFVDNKWITFQPLPEYLDRVLSITEDEYRNLWLGTPHEGIVRAKINIISPDKLSSEITRFTENNGLPPGQKIPYVINNEIKIGTIKGLKYFDKEKEQFFPDTSFGSIFADSLCEINFIKKDKKNDVWIVAKKNEKIIAGKAELNSDGTYSWYDEPYKRINDLGNIYLIYPEENETVWFGGSEGIARYSSFYDKDYDTGFPAVIQQVKEINSDSVFYNGILSSGYEPEFDWNNSIRFEFAALSFVDEADKLFQYKLDGYDDKWSEWSQETWKEYTGLPAGNYNFRVRAKNIYNHLSSEDTFAFSVLPPWYRKWWAYLIYIFSIAAIVFLFVKIRVRQLEKRTEKLEKIISERTSTIRSQTEKLKELDKLKSRFFANISHEFRTPLTLILGILDKYLKNSSGNIKDFSVMQKNAKRLLQLINQLLELSKLESGNVKIEAQKTELNKFVRRIASSFISLAEQKNLKFCFNNSDNSEEVFVYIDRNKLETVIYNLLANAIKYSPEGEKVSIELIPSQDNVEIKISNTGVTIPEKYINRIFDRFYQIDENGSGSFEGTGIGLALVKELTELHHGKIKAESRDSVTVFSVILQKGMNHFSPDEVIDENHKDDEIIDILKSETLYLQKKEEAEENESDIILVVEDHIDLRDFISEQLNKDFTVIKAENGEQGLQIAEEKIPDLIISDIMMPQMNGYELCSKIKNNIKTSHIPVILLTAKASIENKLEGLETGADDYLIKPFNTQELKTRVKNLIINRQKMREKFCSEMIIKPADVIVPSNQKVFIEKLTKIIEDHIEEENFSVEDLSLEIGMSRVQLHRKIKAISNQSTSEFIRSYRLQKAAELIRQNAGNFAEIAYKVGFNSQAYFNKSFQKMFDCTPGEFKKKNS